MFTVGFHVIVQWKQKNVSADGEEEKKNEEKGSEKVIMAPRYLSAEPVATMGPPS